jgi:hypothetical protein
LHAEEAESNTLPIYKKNFSQSKTNKNAPFVTHIRRGTQHIETSHEIFIIDPVSDEKHG